MTEVDVIGVGAGFAGQRALCTGGVWYHNFIPNKQSALDATRDPHADRPLLP